MPTEDIVQAFKLGGPTGEQPRKLYGVTPGHDSACKIGALDFINDVRFTLLVRLLARQWTPAYRYVVDHPNPWQPSSRAHHAVNLLLLFGGFDLGFNPGAGGVGREMRNK